MENYLSQIKENLEKGIPDYGTRAFEKIRDDIRKQLAKKENDSLLIRRGLKVLVLGDWFDQPKRDLLYQIRNTLLKNGIYAETVDSYYDMNKKSGLSQIQILETCCTSHQLIIFIDGEGKGTITEQNYLANEYLFHGKIVFFINEPKFNDLKETPTCYIKSFPTIITYQMPDLLEKVLVYSRFRIYRLTEIIQIQESSGKGLRNPNYQSWSKRLKGN